MGSLFLIAGLVYAAFNSLVVYIHPFEYGIKEVKIGVDRGIHKDIYATGWAMAIPGVSRFHLLPREVQVFDLTNSREERAGGNTFVDKAAHIQTSDGFYVDVDVSILYRIVDPYTVITKIGPGQLYVMNGIVPRAEPILKQALGTLTTEEFYNSHKRTARIDVARALLDKELSPIGMQIEQVLIRYFKYSPEIQRNIEEKKLKDQLVFKNQSEARSATAEAQLKKVVQEGEARLAVKLEEGEAYITEKKAEQELYSRKRRAEADLLLRLADAYRTDLKNQALQGVGSEYMVGLKMAEALGGLEVVVLPSDGEQGVNPLRLDDLVKMFILKK